MRIFVLTGTYELRVSRKSHLRDHPSVKDNVDKDGDKNKIEKQTHEEKTFIRINNTKLWPFF